MEGSIDYTQNLIDIHESILSLQDNVIEINQNLIDEINTTKSINTLLLFIVLVLLFTSLKEKVFKWIR